MPLSRTEKLAAFQSLVGRVPDVDLKGKKTAYTSMNGNMFSFLSPQGELAFRLSAEDRADFLERYPGATVEQYGKLMKDYVQVPDALLTDQRALSSLFEQTLENARKLRPKPTKRPHKAT